jgi:hypothetical protein
MAAHRFTVRVPRNLGLLLRERSRAKGQTISKLVRGALQTDLGREPRQYSAYTLAEEAGLIGCVRGAPKNLSTNRRHFETMGTNK